MDFSILLLRVVHIFAGVFWIGTTFFFVGFLEPAVRATTPEGGKVMQRLNQGRFVVAMPLAALLTVLSGVLLYWPVSGRLNSAWMLSGYGLALTLGGLAGIVAFVIGFSVQRPAVSRMGELARAMQASGGRPSAEQLAEIAGLQERIAKGSLWTAALLALSLLGMSTAQYLFF